jgi:hypothetical protein
MYCSHCHKRVESSLKRCPNCGTRFNLAIATSDQAGGAAKRLKVKPGRGGLILTFGLISFFFACPIFGILAWVMGLRDLKGMREGIIESSQRHTTRAGMILGMIMTIAVSVGILGMGTAVLWELSSGPEYRPPSFQSVDTNRDAVVADITTIADDAYRYSMLPALYGGGVDSYTGYTVPASFESNENASYEILEVSRHSITIRGTSAFGYGQVIARYGKDGKLTGHFIFTGQYQQRHDRDGTSVSRSMLFSSQQQEEKA